MLTPEQTKIELERAYRALRGIYGRIAKGEQPDKTMLGYHSLALGAALRFVDDEALDGSEYFVGKPVQVLMDTIARYTK